jgi:hypothetical protein
VQKIPCHSSDSFECGWCDRQLCVEF